MDYITEMKIKTGFKLDYFLNNLELPKSKYYDWKTRHGKENNHNGKIPKEHWHTPEEEKAIVAYVKKHIDSTDRYFRDGYRRLTYRMIDEDVAVLSPSSVYRILKKHDLLNPWNKKKTTAKAKGFNQPDKPHKHWHIDIKYIFFGRRFYFLISIIDGYSRFIVNHGLFEDMRTETITTLIQEAKDKYNGVSPRIISDNGPQFISKEFSKFISFVEFTHVKTSVGYPQSNGKIERFHGTFNQEFYKNTPLLSFEDAKEKINRYIEKYNYSRLHSSLFYLTPNDFLENKIDEKLKIREMKLKNASEIRSKYWKDIKPSEVEVTTVLN